MNIHHTINYIELISHDLEQTKEFYSNCFKQKFTKQGETYIAIDNAGIDGGFELGKVTHGSTRVILYSQNLEQTQQTIITNDGTIAKEPFEFPGGSRFHFTDPSGNELAVWKPH